MGGCALPAGHPAGPFAGAGRQLPRLPLGGTDGAGRPLQHRRSRRLRPPAGLRAAGSGQGPVPAGGAKRKTIFSHWQFSLRILPRGRTDSGGGGAVEQPSLLRQPGAGPAAGLHGYTAPLPGEEMSLRGGLARD